MELLKKQNIEIFLIFLPFAILAFSGVISSNAVVFSCFGTQIASLIGIYLIEGRLYIDRTWKKTVIVAYLLSVICSILGYSPVNSLRVTTMIYLNVMLLSINITSVEVNQNLSLNSILNGFIWWCWKLGCFSVAFSLLGILIGSDFQLIVKDDNVIILSYVKVGSFIINQYAVRGGLVNGNLGVASWFTNPNIFSIICLISYIYCLYNKKRLWLIVPLIGIVLGYSRAILIMTVIITFLYLFQSASKLQKAIILLVAATVVGAIMFWKPLSFFDLNGRQNMWRVLLDYSHKHYYMPTGLGTSSIILKDIGGISLSAHSLYLNVLVEYGLVGVVVLIVILGKTMSHLSRVISHTNENTDYKLQISIIISLLLLGLTEVTAFTFSFFNYLFFFVLFTITREY